MSCEGLTLPTGPHIPGTTDPGQHIQGTHWWSGRQQPTPALPHRALGVWICAARRLHPLLTLCPWSAVLRAQPRPPWGARVASSCRGGDGCRAPAVVAAVWQGPLGSPSHSPPSRCRVWARVTLSSAPSAAESQVPHQPEARVRLSRLVRRGLHSVPRCSGSLSLPLALAPAGTPGTGLGPGRGVHLVINGHCAGRAGAAVSCPPPLPVGPQSPSASFCLSVCW